MNEERDFIKELDDITLDTPLEDTAYISLDEEGNPVLEPLDMLDYKLDTEATFMSITEDNTSIDSIKGLNDSLKLIDPDAIDISDEDASVLLSLLTTYEKNKNINVYNEFPKSLQDIVDRSCKMNGRPANSTNRKQISKMLLDLFVSEIKTNNIFIDFQTALENTLDMPNVIDMYSEYTQEHMEVTLINKANELEERGHVDQANSLRKISTSFTESYKLDRMVDTLRTNRKARNHITKDASKNYKKLWDELNYKNNIDEKFSYPDIYDMELALLTVMPEMDVVDIRKFINLFCRTCEDLDTSIIYNKAFIYYSIKNIVMLRYIEEAKTTFSINLINRIKEVIDIILKQEESHAEAVLSTRKK